MFFLSYKSVNSNLNRSGILNSSNNWKNTLIFSVCLKCNPEPSGIILFTNSGFKALANLANITPFLNPSVNNWISLGIGSPIMNSNHFFASETLHKYSYPLPDCCLEFDDPFFTDDKVFDFKDNEFKDLFNGDGESNFNSAIDFSKLVLIGDNCCCDSNVDIFNFLGVVFGVFNFIDGCKIGPLLIDDEDDSKFSRYLEAIFFFGEDTMMNSFVKSDVYISILYV
ncbi:hypothetical protein WICMUC_005563 [Wickerhamomyces mucosus]|uniref:Uncharacterized protein n=1 Tax=Wickerhamomyces mucosus TaxID=1378264 RepID=A0A9P8T661_9ASCO|nr:hypothetical protein WICMUC_005563 [Wickerhamomyces mucosus]